MAQLIKFSLHIIISFGIGFVILMFSVSPFAKHFLAEHDPVLEFAAENGFHIPNTGNNSQQVAHPTDYAFAVRRNSTKAPFNQSKGLIDLPKSAVMAPVSDLSVVDEEPEEEGIRRFEAISLFPNRFNIYMETFSGNIPYDLNEAMIPRYELNSVEAGQQHKERWKD